MPDPSPNEVVARYKRAMDKRQCWESHWRECYEFAFPQRESVVSGPNQGSGKVNNLFDGTAPDAVEQLAASLLSQLTPPWARWFGIAEGPDISDDERSILGDSLERSARILQSTFDRSNFAVEMHQCYLDLITAGTATLLFEEAATGSKSAFRFTAVPLSQLAYEESAGGDLDTTFRRSELTAAHLRQRFPKASKDLLGSDADSNKTEKTYPVIEAVYPSSGKFEYTAILEPHGNGALEPAFLARGSFRHSPFINFRWLKAPGEVYGRSPVMKALPDIKTANKVVELVLKNASIAVTGIWQADDDGVLNPANISLRPGTIIPKAVGSAGLTPLDAPGRFDLSQLILEDLRRGIRRALLADRLGQPDTPAMTATEVLERAAEMARLLGATYGRLQSELLTPLVRRGLSILTRRGEIPDLQAEGRVIDLEYRSPLARNQSQGEANNIVRWLDSIKVLGGDALDAIDSRAVAHHLGRAFGVPTDLMRSPSMDQPSTVQASTDPLAGVLPGGWENAG